MKKNTILIVFATYDIFDQSDLKNNSFLTIPSREIGKINSFLIIMPDHVYEMDRTSPPTWPLFKKTAYKDLSSALKDKGFSYNQCHCDGDTPIPDQAARCGNIDQCHAEADIEGGYHCHEVRSLLFIRYRRKAYIDL